MRIKYENSISKQGKERMKKNLENWKPIIVMIGCQVIYAGVTLSGRAALLQHFSSPIFVVYRQLSAFFFIAPFAFFSRLILFSFFFNFLDLEIIGFISKFLTLLGFCFGCIYNIIYICQERNKGMWVRLEELLADIFARFYRASASYIYTSNI